MNIAGRPIGADHPVYIIAEIGVNHDGSLDTALALVDAAAEAGADAVKVQVFRAEMLMSTAARLAAYQSGAGESDPIAMLRRLELAEPDLRAVADRCRARAVHCIATVFSVPLVPLAESIGFDAYKTASPDIVHQPLLTALAATGKPLLVSTGAATLVECLRAQRWLARTTHLFLHCVSAYPTEPGDATLGGVPALAEALDEPVGYSDHTTLTLTGALAVAAGACALEKHLTHDRAAPGPDHAASLDPTGFAEYVQLARLAGNARGPRVKGVLPVEADVRAVSRQSIVSTRRLRAGERLDAAHTAFKRPGSGLEPWRIEEALRAAAARDIEADTPITPEDLGLRP